MRTPIRVALRDDSPLHQRVKNGIGAMKDAHRTCLSLDVRQTFGDSLDLDAAFLRAHPDENRWDYLLGHSASELVMGIEPHSARDDEVTTVINKRKAAQHQLVPHFKRGAKVSRWIWVASGKVRFADTEKSRRRLDQNGIEFVGEQVLARHLPVLTARKSGRRK